MDGLTQGAIGAVAAQTIFGRRLGRWSLPIGFASGMLADADLLIRTASDPLLGPVVIHRGFSHSLLFIPVGALLATLPFLLSRALRRRWREVYLCALLGYATHGLIDACTSYGTQLLWPLSNHRFSWDLISVVDAFFTLPLLVAMALSCWRRSPRPARLGMAWAGIYLGLCFAQSWRVSRAQDQLAEIRGDVIVRKRQVPAPLTNLAWRSIYLTEDGTMVADSMRANLTGELTFEPGERLDTIADREIEQLVDRARRPRELRSNIERWRWFTDGFMAITPGDPELIGDMRITGKGGGFSPLWGLQLRLGDRPEVAWGDRRDNVDAAVLWNEILGRSPGHRPVSAADEQSRR